MNPDELARRIDGLRVPDATERMQLFMMMKSQMVISEGQVETLMALLEDYDENYHAEIDACYEACRNQI